jgi:hypothetical protein
MRIGGDRTLSRFPSVPSRSPVKIYELRISLGECFTIIAAALGVITLKHPLQVTNDHDNCCINNVPSRWTADNDWQ